MSSGLANGDGGLGTDTFVARLLFGEGSRDVFGASTGERLTRRVRSGTTAPAPA